MKTFRLLLGAGSGLAFLTVGLGAFGAHALKNLVGAAELEIFRTGVHYQGLHALGLLVIALLARLRPSPLLTWAGTLLFAGVILFSGSLYLLALTGIRGFGAVTPIGGLAFLAGWGCLTAAAWRWPENEKSS